MFEFITTHFDFKFHRTTIISLIIALLVLPCVLFLPEKYGYENGVLENIQMFVLFVGIFFAFTSKINKKFFTFAGLVLIILTLREVNCGRTLFFPIPGTENAFYSWKDIKYGYLAHPLFGLYIASVAVYFLWNKLFINLWKMITNLKLPVWDIILMVSGAGLGMYAEHVLDNMVFEEITELLFYTALVGIVWLYSRHKDYAIEDK